MNDSRELWDGLEPVTAALDRLATRERFDLAIRDGCREQAVSLLIAVGVPEVKAVMIIDGVLVEPAKESEELGPGRSS
jgi:hypothetical protein